MNLQFRSKAAHSTASQRSRTKRRLPGSSAAVHDVRWPRIAAALAALRENGRYAVRIVDADCGAGCLLLHALHEADELGFKAIEGRGIDGSPALIGRARAAASRGRSGAVGVVFEAVDMASALRAENEFPADIVIWHGSRAGDIRPDVLLALRAAGDVIIGDNAQLSFARIAA